MEQKELYHYGVLGMKWGVRRAQKRANIALKRASGASTESRRKKFHDDYIKKQAEADKKRIEYERAKTNQTKGERVAERILLGIGGAAVASTAVAVGVGVTRIQKILREL